MFERHQYDYQWIMDHYDPNLKWSYILKEYNRTFNTDIKYPTFVSHMNRKLGLQLDRGVYTREEDDFLAEHYPNLGYIETTKLYNQHFGKNRTPEAVEGRCHKIGLKVTKERKSASCPENHKRSRPVGSIADWGCHGEIVMKTDNGWVNVKELVAGKKPGMFIIHLDGDVKNNSKENLYHVSREEIGVMTRSQFWSQHPEVTKTGILWSRLYILLRDTEMAEKDRFEDD